jgi:hypothetical protein
MSAAVTGVSRTRSRKRAQVTAAVALLTVALVSAAGFTSRADAGGGNPWAALRRPLHLPKLAAGAKCPVSHVDRRVAWKRINIFGGSGLGRGPVYPGIPSAFLMASRDEQYGGPWFGDKVFWYVLPSYRGPVLLRGRRLDGPQKMGFNGAKLPLPELRIAPDQSVSWSGQPPGSRGVPSGVRVLVPGCYGVQIDGASFSRIVVFRVDTAS